MNATPLLNISEAAEMLQCSVAKVRQMVIGDRTLAAVHEDYQGFPAPFELRGLRLFDVNDLGAMTNVRTKKPAGWLRFALAEVVRALYERAHIEAAAVPLTTAPVGAGNEPVKQVNAMKKVVLIAALEYEWPSIVSDISEATRNGLKPAAHTGKHGEWDKDKARAWAVSSGKIKQSAPVHSLAGAWPGTTTRHTITG